MARVEKNGAMLSRVLGIVTIGSLFLFMLEGLATASHVEPEVVRGSPICSDYSANGVEFTIHGNERFQEEDSGQFTDGTFAVDVTFYATPDGQEFDWAANLEVDVIVAKGGSLASIYRYEPSVTSDSGLHAPFDDDRSHWYPSRYISFCYQVPQSPPPTESSTTAAVVASSTTVAPTSTTVPAEVLPTEITSTTDQTSTTKPVATTTTTPAEVKDTEVLPFTGLSGGTIWLLGLSLLAIGSLAVFSTDRSKERDNSSGNGSWNQAN